jgi:hypothetical protein
MKMKKSQNSSSKSQKKLKDQATSCRGIQVPVTAPSRSFSEARPVTSCRGIQVEAAFHLNMSKNIIADR